MLSTTGKRTVNQQAVANELGAKYGIDADRILFLNSDNPNEPWLDSEALITIARQSGNFQAIDESFDQFIQPLQQVVHRATLIDKDGRTFSRSGVATIGEREGVSEHSLAAARALNAVMTAAGFNPLRPGTVVPFTTKQEPSAVQPAPDEATSRNQDLKRIHAIAVQKGLITPQLGGGRDLSKYRQHLMENYGVSTAAGFDAVERASLVNSLNQLPDQMDEFENVA